MSAPTKVITKQKTSDSGSRTKETSELNPPASTQLYITAVTFPVSGGEEMYVIPVMTVIMADKVTEPTPSTDTATFGRIFPKMLITRKLSNGIDGISQRYFSISVTCYSYHCLTAF
jgi:hypothetical protein